MTGARNNHRALLGKMLGKQVADAEARSPGIFAAQQEHRAGHASDPVERHVIHDKGLKIERRLGQPFDKCIASIGTHRCPSPRAIPVVYEFLHGLLISSADKTVSDCPCDLFDLCQHLTRVCAGLAQNMKRRWLIERQARHVPRTLPCDLESDTAAVRVANDMHRLPDRVDELDDDGSRLVREGNGMRAAPISGACAADEAWSDETEAGAKPQADATGGRWFRSNR